VLLAFTATASSPPIETDIRECRANDAKKPPCRVVLLESLENPPGVPEGDQELPQVSGEPDRYVYARGCTVGGQHVVVVATRDDQPWRLRLLKVFNEPSVGEAEILLVPPRISRVNYPANSLGHCKPGEVQQPTSVPPKGTQIIAVLELLPASTGKKERPEWQVRYFSPVFAYRAGKTVLGSWQESTPERIKALEETFP
jgi:hypothetical protein